MLKNKNYHDFLITLKKLKKTNTIGVKQSLEDEGATFDEISFMRMITKKLGIMHYVKIGGCEAINDILFCKKIKIDGIIAPMIESSYALQKFIQSIKFSGYKNKVYLNIETISAIKNLDKILKTDEARHLSGITIGRSDICGSLNLEKKHTDNKKIFKLTKNAANKIKKYNFNLKIGGSINAKSKNFLQKLYNKKLIKYFETRNIEIKINNKNLEMFNDIIKNIFSAEISWLQLKKDINNQNNLLKRDYKKRTFELKKRLDLK